MVRSLQQRSLQERRREALRGAGVTQAQVAARLGVSRQSVGLVLADHHRSRRVEQAIADACGLDVETLFPREPAVERPEARPAPASAPAWLDAPAAPVRAAAAPVLARPTPLQPTSAQPANAPMAQRVDERDLARALEVELRRAADAVFLAMAEQGLAADHRAVRAAAAAVRELGR
jgi:transcriptional regulator with XRE-family HTH domain